MNNKGARGPYAYKRGYGEWRLTSGALVAFSVQGD
jgi:hypothetical protein